MPVSRRIASATFRVMASPSATAAASRKGRRWSAAGIGTHPARVRAAVADEAPLVVLDRRGCDDRPAVAEALQGELLALQFLLHGHARMDPEDIAAVLQGLRTRLKVIPLDENPLAPGQTVRFEDDAVQFIEEGFDADKRLEIPEARVSGDTVFFEQVPREGLRCFQTGEGAGRSHRRDSSRRECVYDAVAQRVLGADDGEGDAGLTGKSHDGLRLIVSAEADLLREGSDAGVVCFHEGIEAGVPFRAQNRLGDRVFPGPVADKKDMGHERVSFRCRFSRVVHTYRKKDRSQTNPPRQETTRLAFQHWGDTINPAAKINRLSFPSGI